VAERDSTLKQLYLQPPKTEANFTLQNPLINVLESQLTQLKEQVS
jgi:hypothetical protein